MVVRSSVQCIVNLEAVYSIVQYCVQCTVSSVVKASIGEIVVREGGVIIIEMITVTIMVCYHKMTIL